jgi:hypothetical protein
MLTRARARICLCLRVFACPCASGLFSFGGSSAVLSSPPPQRLRMMLQHDDASSPRYNPSHRGGDGTPSDMLASFNSNDDSP